MIVKRMSDPIVHEFNRKWEVRLEFEWFKGPQVALHTYLTQFKGEKCDRLVSGYHIGFWLKEWTIEAFHQYYDGENCHWQFGPFVFARFGTSTGCKKCRE
jgi:hypothetical protein